jgi:hypothetical protein
MAMPGKDQREGPAVRAGQPKSTNTAVTAPANAISGSASVKAAASPVCSASTAPKRRRARNADQPRLGQRISQ